MHTTQGTCVISASVGGKKKYVAFKGGYDSFYGPEAENYQIVDSSDKAARFTKSTGIDIDIIDAKKFLPGHKWKKEEVT